ncbi:SDR family NAD(P)-dependent oxidoreductase [Tsukamurella ocularis]|uniref:SDR family NAD(P)-dependent oxidoreductase n=1 Tax=Tsukamurella ocularis TaxID=1970234 RepID=UPI0021679441|nr:SDR family NAD(P)-dependent oxidoreductase [Tsukamurella ocularis]MCS3780117.1 NAD(P)-dependent dehydrogenase (short-subunit alcohol dehydrogenase family) [Tsukamurella ocularis]MCS3786329.1 NAD(P)-dependent dehydrogenase (short-subunit alcohol dehydrogenase family) [Tsukamurella ocularis]MCS3849693.1 NAD(P)-dependent dehydrogenase (short-subunit alcohol dehydrogenase family) [Tsukamurella ocularis]
MNIESGTVLITGPTGGLGRAATLALASRPTSARPDLLLVGRGGSRLDEVTAAARAGGATVQSIAADLASLADVRDAAARVRSLVGDGTVRPLRSIVANAGVSVLDTHGASADGYETTFAVNHLAHAQLIGDLLPTVTEPARIVLLGSNTYYENIFRRIIGVPAARWRDPLELARPTPAGEDAAPDAAGVAYSDSKLAVLYYAHELQRRAPHDVHVLVFEPGFMPGTGLSREHGAAMQRIGRLLERVPRVSSPARSGPLLASVAVDAAWTALPGAAFVVKGRERKVEDFACDPVREARLWEATQELLRAAR